MKFKILSIFLLFTEFVYPQAQQPSWSNITSTITNSPPYWVGYTSLQYSDVNRFSILNPQSGHHLTIYTDSLYSLKLTPNSTTSLYISPNVLADCTPDSATIPMNRHPVQQRWYDPIRNYEWTTEGVCSGTIPMDMYYYDLTANTGTWVQVTPAHYPNAGVGGITAGFDSAAVSHDTDNDIFWLFGPDSSGIHRLWIYCPTITNPSPGTLTPRQAITCSTGDDWIEAPGISGGWNSGTNQPGNAAFIGTVYDKLNHKLIGFGGLDGSLSVGSNQLWVLDTSPSWQPSSVGIGFVPGYTLHSSEVCPTTPGWCNMNPPNPPLAQNASLTGSPIAYNIDNGLMYYHYSNATPGAGAGGAISRDYAYNYLTNQWLDFGTNAGPSYCPSMAYDSSVQSLLLYCNIDGLSLYVWKGTFPTIYTGRGSSTYTCVDQDGDGYGTGTGCLGPDADDQDPTVNTTASAIAKYGTILAYVQHLGYFPGTIWYISPSGNDSTGNGTVGNPYLTCAGALGNGSFATGDMIMMRNGNFANSPCTLSSFPSQMGTSGHSNIILAYPGELPSFTGNGSGMGMINTSWQIVDGIQFAGPYSTDHNINGGSFNLTFTSTFHNNIFRHIHSYNATVSDFQVQNGLVDVLLENNSFHDPNGQHTFYMGSNETPGKNVTVRNNLNYNTGPFQFTCGQFNGRVTNYVNDSNLNYQCQVAGVSLLEGVSYSFIRNDQIVNIVQNAIALSNYSGNCSDFGQGGFASYKTAEAGATCPFNQVGNVFENNTIYLTGKDSTGTAVSFQSGFNLQNDSVNHVGNLSNQTLRNNIFVVSGNNNIVPPIAWRDDGLSQNCTTGLCLLWYSTSIFDHTLYFQNDGNNGNGIIGVGGSGGAWNPFNCTGAATYTTMLHCLNSDPLFISASPTFFAAPTNYNLNLHSASPGATGASPLYVTLRDNLGKLYTLASPFPSVGALQITLGCNITPTTLPNGIVGNVYATQFLTANSCGTNPLTWTILSGTLPPGLTGCNFVTNPNCNISGTPSTNVGSPYNFNIQVSDGGSNIATQAYSIIINAAIGVSGITSFGPITSKGPRTIKQ